jgi:hypothetical protein
MRIFCVMENMPTSVTKSSWGWNLRGGGGGGRGARGHHVYRLAFNHNGLRFFRIFLLRCPVMLEENLIFFLQQTQCFRELVTPAF